MNDCIFCKIASKEIPVDLVYEDERIIAFLDMKPINPGHTLIVPREHVDHFFDMSLPVYQHVFDMAKKIAPKLKDAMGSARIGVLIEGLDVPHAHVHLIPINGGREIDHERARVATPEELKEIREKIKAALL